MFRTDKLLLYTLMTALSYATIKAQLTTTTTIATLPWSNFLLRSANVGIAVLDGSRVYHTIFVNEAGLLSFIVVDVNINHTFIGDLAVRLFAPDNTSVLLHNRTGGSADNIVTSYPTLTESANSLNVLIGKNVLGNWTLLVHDMASSDIGYFNNWTISLYFNSLTQTTTTTTTINANAATSSFNFSKLTIKLSFSFILIFLAKSHF
jgi:subtilisin-like proprotein convertase family protein